MGGKEPNSCECQLAERWPSHWPTCQYVSTSSSWCLKSLPPLVSAELSSISLLYCVWACVHAQSLSHVQLFVTLWTVACQAPLSMEFLRREYWSGLSYPPPGGLPNLPRVEPISPASPMQVDCLPACHLETPSSTAVVWNKVFFAYLTLSDEILIWPLLTDLNWMGLYSHFLFACQFSPLHQALIFFFLCFFTSSVSTPGQGTRWAPSTFPLIFKTPVKTVAAWCEQVLYLTSALGTTEGKRQERGPFRRVIERKNRRPQEELRKMGIALCPFQIRPWPSLPQTNKRY